MGLGGKATPPGLKVQSATFPQGLSSLQEPVGGTASEGTSSAVSGVSGSGGSGGAGGSAISWPRGVR